MAYFCALIKIINILSILTFLVHSLCHAENPKKNPKRLNDSLNQEYTDEERLLGYFHSRNIVLDSCYNYALYKTVINWLGTNYQFAGESNKGIDCSGFATVLYKEAYGINLSGPGNQYCVVSAIVIGAGIICAASAGSNLVNFQTYELNGTPDDRDISFTIGI